MTEGAVGTLITAIYEQVKGCSHTMRMTTPFYA